AKLTEIIGTGIYFPPETLREPVQFDISQGKWVTAFDPALKSGRYVVPLPHPSGASLWPNKPANKALIAAALGLIKEIRTGWQLS
ncbi:MAG: hypothetical protein AAF633_16625, partial [Chloroflexota bacterium]